MKINLLDKKEQIALDDKVFNQPFNEPLVHQVVVGSIAASHRGTKAQKGRGEVRGGGRKPWRQKGTGRARVGSTRNPIWRGGGVTFAAQPSVKKQKVNRRMYRQAMRSILSGLVKDGRFVILSQLTVKSHKTKDLFRLFKRYDFHKGCVVVTEMDQNLSFAARNLANIRVVGLGAINPHLLVGAPKILFTQDACQQLEKSLS